MAPTPSTSSGGTDPQTQMNTYRSFVTMLGDPKAKEEIKLKAAQELSENFEVCVSWFCIYLTFISSVLTLFSNSRFIMLGDYFIFTIPHVFGSHLTHFHQDSAGRRTIFHSRTQCTGVYASCLQQKFS